MAWFTTRATAVVGFTFVLAVSSSCGGSKKPPMTPTTDGDGKAGPAEVGKSAPDLSIQTVNGKGSVTLETLSGKIAVVDFWATWCGPCKQSFPKLEELAKQNSGKVQVIGISVDDKSDGVADFAKANGATFPIGWDDGHTIAGRWKVDTMPTTYILDTSGKVRFIHAGYKDGEADVIAKELATLASEPSSGAAKPSTTDAGAEKPVEKPVEKPAEAAADPPPDPTPVKKPGAKKPGAKPKKDP